MHGVKIQWFMEKVRISDKSNLLSILDNIISFLKVDLLNGANGPSAWSNLLWSGGASISLINSIDFVAHIEHHEPIGLLVHKHHVIAEFQLAIMAIGLGNSLETLGELLLGLVNH